VDGTLAHMSDQDRSLLNDEVDKLRRDPHSGRTTDLLDSLCLEARRLISRNADAIADVAAHLQEHGTSYGYEIGTIVEKSLHAARRRGAVPGGLFSPERVAKRKEVMRRLRAGLPLHD
jgi:hypothetical protein